MTDDVNADKVAAARKREEKLEFMRAFVLAAVKEWKVSSGFVTEVVEQAREAWDAIEAEAEASK